MNHFIRALLVSSLVALACIPASAQSSLSIVDALPPYLLSCRFTNNGHFSISTKYTGTPTTIIYREDGTGNRPVNYTSHVHLYVDGVVYQMAYEEDTTTRTAPPPHPLAVKRMYPDTVAGRPRINVDVQALTVAEKDTIRATLTMEPVLRSGGAFIRFTITVDNRGTRPHDIGALLLVDTKIGANDRAPIATAYGYSGVETKYERKVAPGLPAFWLALEGTPTAPGLVARGNLRGTELIEPDEVIFGNWTDDPTRGIPGLYRTLWKGRPISPAGYTDSAILLLWDSEDQPAGIRRIVAATEIGIADSLSVLTGGGSGGGNPDGGGGLALAGQGGCLEVETITERPCGDPSWSVYAPDTVQTIYLVTNLDTVRAASVRLVVGAQPRGVQAIDTDVSVIQDPLAARATGVGLLSFAVSPRLADHTYEIPVAVVRNGADTVLKDSVCIIVPGVAARIKARDHLSVPVCPGETDTVEVTVDLDGPRCRQVVDATIIDTPSPTLAQVLQPLPMLAANGSGRIHVTVSPAIEGQQQVRIAVHVRDEEVLAPGDTTWVELRDTLTLTIVGRPAEFAFVPAIDSIDLGDVCIGDSVDDDLIVQNLGGCDVELTAATWIDDAGGTFKAIPDSIVERRIGRALRNELPLVAFGRRPGVAIGKLRITSAARPQQRDVAVRVNVVRPAYTIAVDTVEFDTVCPNERTVRMLSIYNPTPCPVSIDSVTVTDPSGRIRVTSSEGFTISARGRVTIPIVVEAVQAADIIVPLSTHSVAAGDQQRMVHVVVRTRQLAPSTPSLELGDVRKGTTVVDTVEVTNVGDAPMTVTSLRLAGTSAADYAVVPADGRPFPFVLQPSERFDVRVTFTPSDIETRRATLIVATTAAPCAVLQPIVLTGRGVVPIMDIATSRIGAGAVCIGTVVDTVITIRNAGNSTLRLTSIAIPVNEASLSTTASLPIAIDSGMSVSLPLRIAPRALGTRTLNIHLEHDGEWLSAVDTTVDVSLRGVLCADVSIDTIRADVGARIDIPVRLRSRYGLAPDSVTLLLVGSAAPLRVQVRTDKAQVDVSNVDEGLAGASAAGTTIVPGLVDIERPDVVPTAAGDVVTILRAEVLLGPQRTSPLLPAVVSMANGDVELRILPGLLQADRCAFDNRTVEERPIPAVWNAGGGIVVYLPDGRSGELRMTTLAGAVVHTVSLPRSGGGTTSLPIPDGVAHGWYGLVLTTDDGQIVRTSMMLP